MSLLFLFDTTVFTDFVQVWESMWPNKVSSVSIKAKDPDLYRVRTGCVSYFFVITFQLVTLIGWTVATGIGIAVIYGPYSVFKPDGTMFGTAQNILYASLSRLAWALALAWVVYACQYKRGGMCLS